MTDPRTPVLIECPTTMDAASLRPLHAMLSIWGTLQFSLWRALGRGIRRLRICRQRATLVQS